MTKDTDPLIGADVSPEDDALYAAWSEQIEADVDFHKAILEASHNPMLRSVGAMIQSALTITFSLGWRTVMAQDAVLQHRAVYDAIRLRDRDAAYIAMRKLLRNSKGNVFDAIWVAREESTKT